MWLTNDRFVNHFNIRQDLLLKEGIDSQRPINQFERHRTVPPVIRLILTVGFTLVTARKISLSPRLVILKNKADPNMGSKRTSQHNRLGRYGVGLGLAWFIQIHNKGFGRAQPM